MKSKIKIQLAREFRKAPTKSEKMMWHNLRRNNFKDLYFRRQHVIDGYIVDFYCPKLKLAIEIDGSVHLKQIREDGERQKILEAKKIKFFRVSSWEVENNIDLALKNLEKFISPIPGVMHAWKGTKDLKLVPSPMRNEWGRVREGENVL